VAPLLADQHDRLTEQRDVDVPASRPQGAVAHVEDGCTGDQQRDDADTDRQPHDEGDGGVEGCEHECRHRGRHGGADEQPERGAEPLVVFGADADIARCLLHYPRWVTETVDVLIIAPDVPTYAHPGDAGADLVAAEAVRLEPGRRAVVGTGVRVALPDGFAAFVVPRSGLAAKHGITVVNAPGTVDAGYRGEIKVTLLNTDAEDPYDIAVGDRIAQLIVMPVTRAHFIPVETLPESVRGVGGFGSTGYQRDGIPA
jgi:dUTP pyrophosphatase